MTSKNLDFERSYSCAVWLVDRLAGDHALLRTLMGGGPDMTIQDAMGELEREGRTYGFGRSYLGEAWRRIQVN